MDEQLKKKILDVLERTRIFTRNVSEADINQADYDLLENVENLQKEIIFGVRSEK